MAGKRWRTCYNTLGYGDRPFLNPGLLHIFALAPARLGLPEAEVNPTGQKAFGIFLRTFQRPPWHFSFFPAIERTGPIKGQASPIHEL
jgi:hypothetical protein